MHGIETLFLESSGSYDWNKNSVRGLPQKLGFILLQKQVLLLLKNKEFFNEVKVITQL